MSLGSLAVRRVVFGSFALAAALADRRAGADWLEPGWYLLPGASLSAVSHDGQLAAGVGAEISVAYNALPHDLFAGAYVDALYDTLARRARIGFGPELGYTFFGVDGGPAIDATPGGPTLGWYGRIFASAAFVDVYARAGGFPSEPSGAVFFEGGLMLKLPRLVAAAPSTRRPMRPAP
jgi:hypothetical protein